MQHRSGIIPNGVSNYLPIHKNYFTTLNCLNPLPFHTAAIRFFLLLLHLSPPPPPPDFLPTTALLSVLKASLLRTLRPKWWVRGGGLMMTSV